VTFASVAAATKMSQQSRKRSGRAVRQALPTPPYLVLLRAGFCLPPTLPPARCALTAPFHPYPHRGSRDAGGMFSVPLSVKLPCPGVSRRTALWSSDFPPADALSRVGAASCDSLGRRRTSPCGAVFRRDDHSSSLAITGEVKRPTRKPRTDRPSGDQRGWCRALPYLVLLRAGFCLPPTLRPARCALTAPFHPYPP